MPRLNSVWLFTSMTIEQQTALLMKQHGLPKATKASKSESETEENEPKLEGSEITFTHTYDDMGLVVQTGESFYPAWKQIQAALKQGYVCRRKLESSARGKDSKQVKVTYYFLTKNYPLSTFDKDDQPLVLEHQLN
jgi:hypothetical protein